MKRQHVGFTLIELVVVILILSVLAATALPKFMDVTSKAHKAAVAGAGGGLGSAVALVHAQWVANGSTGAVDDVLGFGAGDIDVNANGWPMNTTNGAPLGSDAHCVELWNGVMQNPPSVAATTATGEDYAAVFAGTTCTFTYQPDTSRIIAYDASTGGVAITNP
jgi:MSHA pilin protein MshB